MKCLKSYAYRPRHGHSCGVKHAKIADYLNSFGIIRETKVPFFLGAHPTLAPHWLAMASQVLANALTGDSNGEQSQRQLIKTETKGH